MLDLPSSHKEAREQGIPYYFTGIPCKRSPSGCKGGVRKIGVNFSVAGQNMGL